MKHFLLCVILLLLPGTGTSSAKVFRTDSHITEVSKNSISVQIGHAHHFYRITSETVVQLDGLKVKPKALRKGMHADVTASQIDRHTAAAINATSGS